MIFGTDLGMICGLSLVFLPSCGEVRLSKLGTSATN